MWGALAPVARFTAGISRSTWSGVWWNHDSPVWGLAGKENDHGSGERCSGLDLISGDRGPGYAARGINNRGIRSGVSLLRLRGDVLATSPSSPWVSRISSAPPLCAPARVIPGRTLLGVKVGFAPVPSLNFKLRRLALSDECLEVPVPVLLQTRSNAARFSDPRSVMVSISRLTLSVLKARSCC